MFQKLTLIFNDEIRKGKEALVCILTKYVLDIPWWLVH